MSSATSTYPSPRTSRLGAYLRFLAAVLYFFAARGVAARAARSLVNSDEWSALAELAILVFLLLAGYASFGFWFDKQMDPIATQGLPRRAGWQREILMGLGFGWAIAIVCVLAMALVGGIATSFTLHLANFGWFFVDFVLFALMALAEEIAFRGYAFQCFERSVGSVGAALAFAAFYAILQAQIPGANRASILIGVVFTLLLSAAYVRTRALWVSWGINFGWKAIRALVFGLAVSGVNSHSPLVQGDPMGSFWLTGGSYGLDGSWFAFFVLLAAIPFLFRITEDLDFEHNAPVIVPGGISVDLDAIARAQHEAATVAAPPAAAPLVQILPAAPPSPPSNPEQGTGPS
ncbi:MAG: CPBP family glutamic-type intramembrane protease [Terracidiphilus sp.]|nr:CPBP family glutamic-type intramembrane protease [Terracidiphilus sp.]